MQLGIHRGQLLALRRIPVTKKMREQPVDSSGQSGPHAAEATGSAVVRDLIRLARPRHWIKNGIVLLPVVFAKRIGDPMAWVQAALAAVAFCFASSAVYALNDIKDRHHDREHPLKKDRPLASGKITPIVAGIHAAALAAAALAVPLGTNLLVPIPVLAYLALQLIYTY